MTVVYTMDAQRLAVFGRDHRPHYSEIDPIIQGHFIPIITSNSPVVTRRFEDRYLKVDGVQIQFALQSLEKQLDQVLLRIHRSSFKLADFDDGVAFRATRRKDKIIGFEREEPMGTLVGRVLQGFDDAHVDRIGYSVAGAPNPIRPAQYFDLPH